MLRDGGHNILKCSNCSKSLMDIWITRPDIDYTYKYRALCPYCNDKSFVKELTGGIHFSGIYKDIDEDNDKALTIVDSFNEVDGVIEFKVLKC